MQIESETFHIDTPDELAQFSTELYQKLVDLIEKREGKLLKFTSLKQARRVVNDLAILAERDKRAVFVDKVTKSFHRRIYVRPAGEA